MHLRLTKPPEKDVCAFLAQQSRLAFSYREVGRTAGTPPGGFTVDRVHAELGSGRRVYRQACDALRRWEPFDVGWVQVPWPDTPLEPGRTVVILVRVFGIWSLNACRIVHVFDQEDGALRRFGFSYGTLPGHAEAGEERFAVHWDRDSDRVSYDILAFFRPHRLVVRVAWPYLRHRVNRFRRESAAVMRAAVAGDG